jgi:hypothetical protein
MGLDQKLKQGSNGILDGLTAQPVPAASSSATIPDTTPRQSLFDDANDSAAAATAISGKGALKTQTRDYHHQFRQPNSMASGSGDSSAFDSSMTSSQRQIREEEQRERVEVHPLMGMSAATAPTQPVISQSINYQMTKQRQLARSVSC